MTKRRKLQAASMAARPSADRAQQPRPQAQPQPQGAGVRPGPGPGPGPGSRGGGRMDIQGYDPASSGMLVDRLYPGGRPDIREIRNMERAAVVGLSQPGADMLNPHVPEGEGFDRTQPQGRIAKNQALGFQVQPNRIIDLPPGDAGAGQSMFRRTQVFARLDNPANSIVAGNPFDHAIPIATQRSSDTRPRFWHISFFGIAVQRVANPPATLEPLSESEILSAQLEPVTGAFSTVPFVPSVSSLKGRVLIQDESGGRYFDVDVLGNRSFDVYAWAVTVFILVPGNAGTDQTGYEVLRVPTPPGAVVNPAPLQSLSGLVEDSIVAARVVPIAINSTQNEDQRTITIVTGNAADTRVPIPPGAKTVQVISHEPLGTAQNYNIFFDAGNDGTFAGRSDLGLIDLNAGTRSSDPVLIPNASQIIFSPFAPLPPAANGWSLIFTVESQ